MPRLHFLKNLEKRILRAYSPKSPEQDFLEKFVLHHLVKLDDILTAFKKQKTPPSSCREKLQTN